MRYTRTLAEYPYGTYTRIDYEPMLKWGEDFRDKERQIGRDTIGDDTVSTIFLGLDHSFNFSDSLGREVHPYCPTLYETMIARGGSWEEQWRWRTDAEARAGHAFIVAALRAGGSVNLPLAEITIEEARAVE